MLRNTFLDPKRIAVVAAVFTSILSSIPVFSGIVLPHVAHTSLNLRPYNCTATHHVTYWKNKVYVGGANTCTGPTIWAVDVTDPNNMVYKSGAGDGCKCYGVKVVEDVLYSANWYTMMRAYDVSGDMTQLGEWFGQNQYGWNLDVSNNRAYVNEGNETQKKLYIMDVTNPSSPGVISYVPLSRGGGVSVRGSYAYITDDNRFEVINISDETNPYIVSSIDFGHLLLGGVQIRGNYAYMYWSQVTDGGLVVIDISDPTNPVKKGEFAGAGATDMCLLGNYAFYPTSGNGFYTIDISNPSNPYAVAQSEVPFYALELCCVGNGRELYVGSLAGDNEGWLTAFDVLSSDPDDAGPGNCAQFSPAEASWDMQYDCDALPVASGWTLHEGSEGSASASSGVVRVNDVGSSDVRWRKGWDATNTRGATVVFRAKCDSYSQNGQSLSSLANVTIEDGKYLESLAILPTKLRIVGRSLEAAIDGTAWHTYRVTTQGANLNVYVDENPTPILSSTLLTTSNRARVIFGAGSGAASQDISFDYIYCYSNGVFAPPVTLTSTNVDIGVKISEIAGKNSMSGINPTSARVHWSTDAGTTWSSSSLATSLWDLHYGATTLPGAATPPWNVSEGSETYATLDSGAVHVNDNSAASGSKIKWSRAWGVTPSMGATVLARIKCDSAGGDTSLLGNLYVDDGVKCERFRITPTKVEAVLSGKTYNLDATQWHTYRITMRNSQYKLYVDEAATPVMNTAMIGTTDGAGSRVMFGSGASAATQSIYFDYLRYTVDNDYAPGAGPSSGSLAVACDADDGDDHCYLSAGAVPLSYSRTKNKVKFSLMDKNGNTGYSPVYTIKVLNSTPPGAVTSFAVTPGIIQNTLSWTNPSDAWFSGTMIRFKTSGYPSGPADGTLVCDKSASPGSQDGFVHYGLNNIACYYSAFAHDDTPLYAAGALASATPTAMPQVSGFTATAGTGSVSLSWTNPTASCFSGTMIRYKTSGYPSSTTDGTPLCDRTASQGSHDSFLHSGVGNATYYYSAFAHDVTPIYAAGSLASATPGCVAVWLNETFDGYANGNLGGRGSWITSAASAQVVSNFSGVGKAALMDTITAGGSVANQLNFDQRTAGYHYVTLDVAEDATGSINQEIGYVSFQTGGAAEIARLHIQKNRLLMDYAGGSVVLSTSASNLTWYTVKIGFNIDSRTMDLWLGTTSKGTGYAWMGSGTYISRIVIGSDRNGSLSVQKAYIDNLSGQSKPTTVAAVTDDGAWTPSLSKLHFSFDPAACAGEYQYAIGTTSGGTQTRGWTSCGQATDVMATGLSLTQNSTYYISVQVGTGQGIWGSSVTSNGIKVAPAVGILAAKGLADGASTDVKALRGKLVSAYCTGGFYVQEPDEHQGVKVFSSAPVTAGDQVDVCGVMKGSGSERYLDCSSNPVMEAPGPGGPYPVAMSASTIGGMALNASTPGVVGGIGPNNIGLLVTAYGKVTQRQTIDPKYFYIDDGSGLKDGTATGGIENVGIRVIADPASYPEGSYVAATGVISCFTSSGLRPQMLPQTIQLLKVP
jgi:hypothetical protein